MKRRHAREKAVQLLFQMDMARVDFDYALNHQLEPEDESADKGEGEFFRKIVQGTVEHQEEIDALITHHLRGWTLARLAGVDRAILRLATYEIQFRKDIPLGVSLNEAVELAKIYGTDDSPKFINGVLSGLAKESEKEKETE